MMRIEFTADEIVVSANRNGMFAVSLSIRLDELLKDVSDSDLLQIMDPDVVERWVEERKNDRI